MTKYVLLIFGILIATALAADCPSPPPYYGYKFLNPELLDYDSELYPFYAAFSAEYQDTRLLAENIRERDNLQEWYDRYCEEVEIDDVRGLLYGNTINELKRVMDLSANEKASARDLPGKLRSNSFARHLVDYRCREVAQYLLYAKRVEPYVVRQKKTFATQSGAKVEMEAFIDEGLDFFKNTESHYVRLRYAYQLLRLAHYLREYDYFLELHAYLMPKISADPSILYDWIESHRAGVLQSLGNYPESAYAFSRVFERCASCRESAHRSFKIRSDEEWAATSLLCANDHERAMLHVLRAQDRRANLVQEMEEIFRLDADSRALEPLLMRELLELERDLLGLDFNPKKARNERYHNRPRAEAGKRLIELQAFINTVVDAGTAARPDLWLFARGTVEMLGGDYYYADITYAQLRQRTDNDSLLAQLDIFQEVADLLALDYVDDAVELHYYELLKDSDLRARYPYLTPMVNDKLEVVYNQRGQRGKAALLRYGVDAIAKNPQISMLNELMGMTDSLNGNAFDRGLLADRIGKNPVADLHHLTGLYYLQRGQWEIALEYFLRIPAARRNDYGTYVPFVKQFRDKVNYTPDPAATRYNKVDLLERLLALEDDARRTANDTLAARNYFNIGLAHYNMSYFSFNWKFADAFRSSTSAARAAKARTPDAVFTHPSAPLGNLENFTMDRARYYFERAVTRAPTREAAAEALYYAAKTERNDHYATGRPGGERPFSYFRRLRADYADTKYYNYVIEECKTFAWFIARE
ncbi:hypothetical protein [Neolewinella antarctica]|uniref:Tetratricopeptide repeat protein n=1 Tax=Neolewinella antarctica TaxID=442734 RepID=A0ABX0XGM5_9BACT|nr:hypothetical protein [Neolewinella antarctica]NJC27902.1 hypothetical protein [Neolewinella antarctica]